MYKKICDKCKKLIESEKEFSDDNELHWTRKRNSQFGYDERIHLCNSCLEEFEKWLGLELK